MFKAVFAVVALIEERINLFPSPRTRCRLRDNGRIVVTIARRSNRLIDIDCLCGCLGSFTSSSFINEDAAFGITKRDSLAGFVSTSFRYVFFLWISNTDDPRTRIVRSACLQRKEKRRGKKALIKLNKSNVLMVRKLVFLTACTRRGLKG